VLNFAFIIKLRHYTAVQCLQMPFFQVGIKAPPTVGRCRLTLYNPC